MKRVLILGSRGMLGHDLMRVFGDRYDVIGLDKEEVDITQQQATRDVIRDISPDLVINAAGYTEVDGCEKRVQEAFAVNGEGPRNVANGCRDTGAKLVQISTDYIFDGEQRRPYREDDLPSPKNIYGESKLLGERYVQRSLEHYLIIRTQWLYGKHGRNFVETILALADERDKIEVVNDQLGSPTYTVDLVRAILTLVSNEMKGTFHASNRGCCSWYHFALEVLRLAGKEETEIVPVSSNELNRPASRPSFSVLSCEKLKKEAGIEMRTWQEALWDYFSHRGGVR